MENLQPQRENNSENNAEKQEGIMGFMSREREQISELLGKIPGGSKLSKISRSVAAGLALMSGVAGCSVMHDMSEAERHNAYNRVVSYDYYSTNTNLSFGGVVGFGGGHEGHHGGSTGNNHHRK